MGYYTLVNLLFIINLFYVILYYYLLIYDVIYILIVNIYYKRAYLF